MTQPIRFKCRMCDTEEEWDTVDEAIESDWQDASPLGALKEGGVRVHRAYCPPHSI